jgi:RecB family endonuclease NucS
MHSLFAVEGDVARPVQMRSFAERHTERRIQDWSDLNPAIINSGQPMISLGKEIPTSHGHFIDNLFIDGNGVLVAAELKRGRSPRVPSVMWWGFCAA